MALQAVSLQLPASTHRVADSHQALRNVAKAVSTPIEAIEGGAAYTIDIDFGGQTYSVIFDTGSSDLWLPATDVKCYSAYGTPVPVSQCEFGPTFDGTLSGGMISNLNFNISYGDGEFLNGRMGYEDVCLAGIQVLRQQVAVVDYAYWNGDSETSGLMGFAYPALTSAFSGGNASADNVNVTSVYYNNWIFNAIERGLVDSMFSFALERYGSDQEGQLSLGGLPDVETTGYFASTPIQIMELTSRAIQSSNFSYYTIVPEGFGIDDQQIDTNIPVIVDSGTTLNYLPYNLTRQIARAFDPPAEYDAFYGLFEADCNATVPDVSVTIGGTNFHMAAEDILLTGDLGYDSDTGLCLLGIQPMSDIYILGGTFLKNVLAVFDIGASEMRFVARA